MSVLCRECLSEIKDNLSPQDVSIVAHLYTHQVVNPALALTKGQLMEQLGLTLHHVNYGITRLVAIGAVKTGMYGRETSVYITPTGARLLEVLD